MSEVNFGGVRLEKVVVKVLTLKSREYEVLVVGHKWSSIYNGQGGKKGVILGQNLKFSKKLEIDSRMLLERSNDND